MAGNPLQIVVFSSVPPRQVARIIARIRRDAPEARVAGVLYERRPPKTLKKRIQTWLKKMKRLVYWLYLWHRIFAIVKRNLDSLFDAIIRFIHAAPKNPNGNLGYGLDDLEADCKANGIELLITRDIHSEEALDFTRRINADLGLVFGTRILKPILYDIPKQGSINIHKRKVPDYRGGGLVGLWELLDNQKEIGVTVHRVEAKVDVGGVIRSGLIPIDPMDDLESLALKADVVGADLIVAAIRDFANGTVKEIPQTGPSKLFRSPTAEDLLQMKKKLSKSRKGDDAPFRAASLETAAQVACVCRAARAPQPPLPASTEFPGDDPLSPFGFRSSSPFRTIDFLFPASGELSDAALPRGKPQRSGRTGAQRRSQSSHRSDHIRRRVRRQFCEPARRY